MKPALLLYRLVLAAFPPDFRRVVGPELLSVFSRGLRDPTRGQMGFFARELLDLLRNLPAEWVGVLRSGSSRQLQGEPRPPRLLPTLLTDARIALRGFIRRPAFAAAAILTFAIGIGANTAVFTLLHTILFDPLPFREVDRIALVEGNHMVAEATEGAATFPDIREWHGVDRAFEGMSEFASGILFLLEGGEYSERVPGAMVTAEFTQVMGVEPILGRGFRPEEEGPGAEYVVLIGEGFWRSRFGADPNIVGTVINLGGRPRTVVGVMPDHFRFPEGSVVWTPTRSSRNTQSTLRHLSAVGRLAPGVSISQGRAALKDALEEMGGPEHREHISAIPLRDWIFGGQKAPVLIFYAIVSLVLLVACLNVASLFLARNESRRHELAVRISLGAGRTRLIREMVTESLLLAVLGGGLGIALGWMGRDLILAILPDEIPPYFSFEVPPSVLFSMAGIIVASGLFFGLVPSLTGRPTDLQGMLSSGSRAHSAGKPRRRLWSSLVAAEIALALTILISANLMVKSLVRQLGAETGLDAENVVTLYAMPDYSGERLWTYYRELAQEVEVTPGFTSVGMIQWLQTGDNFHWWAAYLEREGQVADVRYQRLAPGYFSTMGILLRAGRDFSYSDDIDSPRVIMVNEAFAERYWPGEDPLGKRLGRGSLAPEDQTWYQVVAVVTDVHNAGYGRPAEPQVYVPYQQSGLDFIHVVARTTLDTPTALRSLRETVRSLDPQVPLREVQTMEQAVRQANWQVPFATWAFGLLSIIALVLAATGVYGLVAFTVTQRARDLAIRVAVGADTGELQRMVLRESLVLAGGGVLTGALLAVVGMRLVESLLFMVGPVDPGVYLTSVSVMVMVALLASYLPARSIVRMAPMTVLGRE